jgi:hypothetical protein
MTVRAQDGAIRLEGDCPIDDAEALLRALSAAPGASVDWRDCDRAHTAVIQVLMAARPTLVGPPRGETLARWIDGIVGRPT